MPTDFTVLLLLNSERCSLVEVELVQAESTAGPRQWLWVEPNWVTLLRPMAAGTCLMQLFDQAVLTRSGDHAELRWANGQCFALSMEASNSLRPEFRRLVHQHLN